MRYVLFSVLLTHLAFSQQTILVTNAASLGFGTAPASTVAPGSLIRVEFNPIVVTGAITPIDPSTVTIQIQPGGAAEVVGIGGPFGVVARLPDNLTTGPADLTMTVGGQISAPAHINIVPVSFGLFTKAGGTGPVLAQNSLTKPARPGGFVTLWGTGLGSTPAAQVSVLLAGHPVQVSYAGPAPGFPATSQINFQIPDDPAIPFGCYVAVAVHAGDYTSNTAMLSTSRDGGPCQSPFGFTADQLGQLDAGQGVYLGQVNLYDMVGHPPSSQWFEATGYVRMESVDGSFLKLDAANLAGLVEPLRAEDASYGCTLSNVAGVRFIGSSGGLGVGPALELSSAAKSLDVPADSNSISFYRAQLPQAPLVDSPDAVAPPFFASGTWQITAPGSMDVPAFTGLFKVAPPVHITGIDRSNGITVQWNGSDYGDDYVAEILVFSTTGATICRAPANASTFTIPALSTGTQLEVLMIPKIDRLARLSVPLSTGEMLPILLRYYPSEVISLAAQP